MQSSDRPESLKTNLENQLSDLGEWFYHNKLTVNTTKTEVIFFGRTNKVKECKELAPIEFQGDVLECKNCVKYLGVVFDENMNWDTHAKATRRKAYLSLHKIKTISSFLNGDTKQLLVNALVMPHITYCSNSWSTMSAVNHRRFDSLIENVSRVVPLNKTFNQITQLNKAVMIFKGIHNLAPNYLCDRINLVSRRHNRRTRFAVQNNLVVPVSRNNFTNRTFIHSSTAIWNSLPAEIKTIDSFLLFKASLKKHIFN